MLLFYHGIGVLLLIPGSYAIERLLPDYEESQVPRYLVPVLSAGPLEETIFFGIPYYVSGSPLMVLISGSVWAAMHLLNTNALYELNLAFANWLFVIPSLFFSLRTWSSGKGWFAVVAHSGWNGVFYAAGCVSGALICGFSENNSYVSILTNVAMSSVLLIFTYVLYKNQQLIRRIRDAFNPWST